jgi:RNA methyltransferase, TrmH family
MTPRNVTPAHVLLESKANATFQSLKKLARDNDAPKRQGRLWLEGDHLCRAAVARGFQVKAVAATVKGLALLEAFGLKCPEQVVLLSQALWHDLTSLQSAVEFAFIVALPEPTHLDNHTATVILDRVQDPGNVGSILRSASAFGFKQVVLLMGSASVWSPKVVRAAMGAHFGLLIQESLQEGDLKDLGMPLFVTSSHGGQALELIPKSKIDRPIAWIFGNEGQGVSASLLAKADCRVCIAQPGGEESLNVAAAAAICLHATAPPSAG